MTTIAPSELEAGIGTDKSNNGSVNKLKSTELIESETANTAENSTNSSGVKDVENKDEEDEWQDLLGSGCILKKLIQSGQPDTRPQRSQICVIKYTCSIPGDTVVDVVENHEIQLGDCDVIQGLDVAISLMNVSEKCKLIIEPRLAYGSLGLPPKIPKNSQVFFDIELVSATFEEDLETLSVPQRKLIGNKKRERGNWWYGRGENNLAIQCYRRALDYLDEVEGGITNPNEDGTNEISDADLQNLLEDRISVCNNMAAAQIKMELYDAALISLQTVLRCQPNNVKALFRKAKVHTAKNDLTSAMKCLQKAKDLSPNDADIQRQINSVSQKIQKQKVTERDLARRMFSGSSNNKKTSSHSQSRKVLLWMTVGATVAVGVASAMAYRLKYA